MPNFCILFIANLIDTHSGMAQHIIQVFFISNVVIVDVMFDFCVSC
jgi:hypothetical protein